jgi:hypothetical protein
MTITRQQHRDAFVSLVGYAYMLAERSDSGPEYRGKPAHCLLALLTAAECFIPINEALDRIRIVEERVLIAPVSP